MTGTTPRGGPVKSGPFGDERIPDPLAARLAAVEAERDDAVMRAARWEALAMQHERNLIAAEARLADVRALAESLERPLAGLRQRANTNEDFAEAALMESERRSTAGRLRAVLDAPARDEGTPCAKHRARGVNPECGDCDQAPARDESEGAK